MPTALRPLRAALVAVALAAPLGVAAPPARAAVVERIVAIVGERAILLSDLRERARPFLVRIEAELPPGARRSAAQSQLFKVLLDRMIDEELEQKAAQKARIAITSREIDEALARIARQNQTTVTELVSEAVRSGLNERQYRDEIRRQVLEARLISLRLQGRVRVTDEDLRSAYRELLSEERSKQKYRAAWIVLDAPAADSVARQAELRAQADRIVGDARRGDDFGALARRWSVDERTRDKAGDLGWRVPGQLALNVERALLALDVGDVSAPLRVGDKLVIVRMNEREETELPSFDEARNELGERVYLEKMNKARRQWLDGLRRRTHVDIRM